MSVAQQGAPQAQICVILFIVPHLFEDVWLFDEVNFVTVLKNRLL